MESIERNGSIDEANPLNSTAESMSLLWYGRMMTAGSAGTAVLGRTRCWEQKE
jgi:hypothetical protein